MFDGHQPLEVGSPSSLGRGGNRVSGKAHHLPTTEVKHHRDRAAIFHIEPTKEIN